MILPDIYFDKMFTNRELVQAIAETFEIEEDEVLIVPNIYMIDAHIMKKVLCESYKVNNNKEFKLMLTFAVEDSIAPQNDIIIFSKLIKILHCKLMVDNYSIVPGAMLVLTELNVKLEDLENIEECRLEG